MKLTALAHDSGQVWFSGGFVCPSGHERPHGWPSQSGAPGPGLTVPAADVHDGAPPGRA